MDLIRQFKIPVNGFLILLGLYAIITLGFHFYTETIVHAIVVGVLFAIAYLISHKFTSMKANWKNFAISGLIAFLIIDPSTRLENILILVLVVAAFVAGKLLRINNMPLFNPIVFALLLASIILGFFSEDVFISWWGAAYFGSLSLLFLAPVVIYNLVKFKRHIAFLTFIILVAILFSFNDSSSVIFMLTTGTIYFFAGVMLTEVKTSPLNMKSQLVFGVIAALAYFGLFVSNLVEYYDLWAITIANIANIAMKSIKLK